MQGFSDTPSVNNAKTAPANIDTSTSKMLSKNAINEENLTTQQKTSNTECALSPNSSEVYLTLLKPSVLLLAYFFVFFFHRN